MTTATNLIISFIIFSTMLLFLYLGLADTLPTVAYIGFFLLVFLLTLLTLNQRVVVPEHRLFVVSNAYLDQFSRILKPGIHYLSPLEKVDDEIDLIPISVVGTIEQVRTNDSVPFSIRFDVTITPTPTDLAGDLRSIMVRVLPRYLKPMVRGRVEESLRELIGRYTAKELNDGRFLPVLITEFDEKFNQKIGKIGVTAFRSVLNEITPPAQYSASVIDQHVRENEAGAQAVVIELLRDSLRGVPNADKHLIAELEKLRTVAGGKGSVIYAPRASQPIEPDAIEEPPLPWEAIFQPRNDEESGISA